MTKLKLSSINDFITNKLTILIVIILYFAMRIYDLVVLNKETYIIFITCGEAAVFIVTGYYFYKNKKVANFIFLSLIGIYGFIFLVWGFLLIIVKTNWQGIEPGLLGLYMIYAAIKRHRTRIPI